MIKINYYGKYGISVRGHAGAAPSGKDIVCAAVSALTYALLNTMLENKTRLESCTLNIGNGKADIFVTPKAVYENECSGAFDAVTCGYKLLAKDYPDFVEIKYTPCD